MKPRDICRAVAPSPTTPNPTLLPLGTPTQGSARQLRSHGRPATASGDLPRYRPPARFTAAVYTICDGLPDPFSGVPRTGVLSGRNGRAP